MAAIQNLALEEAETLAIEHIHLGSDDETPAHLKAGRAVNASFELASAARGTSSRLDILDGRFLRVSIRRPRRPPRDYVIDLRFVDMPMVHSRHIPWLSLKCLAGGLIAFAATELIRRHVASSALVDGLMPASVLLLTFCVCAALFAYYRMRATVELLSRHGRSPLLALEGALRTARGTGEFERLLEATIASVRSRSKQPLAELLRDEMREHHRLHSEGVLSLAAYESARARILRAHG